MTDFTDSARGLDDRERRGIATRPLVKDSVLDHGDVRRPSSAPTADSTGRLVEPAI